MNFFKSVFSDYPDPPQSEPLPGSENEPQNQEQHAPDRDSSSTERRSDVSPSADAAGASAAGWNFGGLIKTFTAKSESMIETYRRDLQEFGTGLKKEIEVAHGSLETVGHAIDEFGNTLVKGTAQIISQGKDAILAADLESDSDNSNNNQHQKYSSEKSLNSKRYSRFEAQVRAIQGDDTTYTEGPEDLNDYNQWKSEFSLEGKSEEIGSFLRENDAMESIYGRVVPNTVDHETFWCRYYYKVYKLKKAEDVRARLVRRMSREEEELSWDVEDDDDDDKNVDQAKPEVMINEEVDGENLGKKGDTELQVDSSDAKNVKGTKRLNVEEMHNSGKEESKVERRDNLLPSKELGNKTNNSVEESKIESSEDVHEMGDGSKETIKEADFDKASNLEVDSNANKNDSATESDEKVKVERKVDDGKSCNKSNDSSLVASQHSANEEEDLGWDEIEDLSSIDEKKVTQSGSASKVDLRKRLSAAEEEEEEDLSWDTEDDDMPAKA